jgi:glycosyltransferase involved in cell wall biosynthesis
MLTGPTMPHSASVVFPTNHDRTTPPRVAFVQDHLVQRGGAERALLAMLDAAPGSEILTAFYNAELCYPQYRDLSIRTLAVDRVAALRAHHRVALPLLPAAFSAAAVDADVVVCCTSGFAQGVRTEGRKIVYFHAVARWLYERDAYLRGSGRARRVGAAVLQRPLEWWDRRTVSTGHRFLTQGTAMQHRLAELYGIDAELLPPPVTIDPQGERAPVESIEPGFFLCASRLLPYKNVDVVIDAFRARPQQRLVVAGGGPLLDRLRNAAGPNVTMLGDCDDATLRWLYGECVALVTAAYEPFGLTPVEAAAFGRPTIALGAGGFLDTVIDGETGVYFPDVSMSAIVDAIDRFGPMTFDDAQVRAVAERHGHDRFVARLRAIIDEEAAA